ncbi:hypothetical protein [Pseudomonas sp. GD03730]|uniref:defense against restriction DarA-related protein n=1 Tax=Pseudomonas sp. GD03730 TaxID=2975375 RepID=UPI00244CDE08|nr:hypothetical protein [Pseudomonas sp. GD03730]MDH1403759.1 hypothetical protein [Pseudomonas sp. GD03730]
MADTFAALQSAAHAGAFGAGSRATPTPEQIRAGNYAKGATRLHGMPITIETPMFQPRRGKTDGAPWSVLCMAHYGYINGTVGADGDAVDVFVGPVPESLRVFVVNQVKRDGTFDEHKVLLGFADEQSARDAYMNSYEKGWTGLGSLTPCSIKQFKFWLKNGDLSARLEPVDLWKKDDELSQNDVFVRWDDQRMPVGDTLGDVIAGLRRYDNGGQMMDAATMADLVEYLSADDGAMLDAMVIEVQQFERKANQLLRVMQMAATGVKPESVEVSKPFKNRGTTQLAMLFLMDDGQSVSVFFHNPDTTPNKLTPTDEMVSWKWVLNKKDITITVAPEKGQDLNPREVARRVMKLVEKNSAKFIQANTNKAERDAHVEALKAAEVAKTDELASLDKQIEGLTAQLAAAKADPSRTPKPQPAAAPASDKPVITFKGSKMTVTMPNGDTATRTTKNAYQAAVVGYGEDGKLHLVSAHGAVVDAQKAIATAKAGKHVNFNYRKVKGEFYIATTAADPVGTEDEPRSQAVKQALAALGWSADKGVLVDLVLDGTHYQLRQSGEQDALTWKDTGSNLVWADDPAMSAGDMAAKINNEFRAAIEQARQQAAGQRPYQEWEGDVLDALAALMEIGRSDADAIAMTQPQLLGKLHAEGKTAQEAAAAVQAASAVEPQTPEEEAMLAQHKAQLAEEAAQAAADAELRLEKEDTGEIEPEGRDNTVKTAKGTKLVTGFKVIDASKLVISHETDGTPNPDYPAEIQPRDRARSTSQAWVQKTARNLDPDSLGRTQRADSGAPIVGPDRVVESGNGRAMAVREAYRIGAADEYREWLMENAEYFGVDVAKIERLKAPVLVRVRKTEVDRVAFAVEANQDDKLAQTATEKARSDARRLDAAMLAKLADGDLNSAANRDFVAAFLQSLGDAEAAQYLTTDGKPTSSLISRLQAALFAGAYSDDRLLEMTADVAKPEIANIVAALNSAAPDFMRAKEHDLVGTEEAGGKVTDSVELSLNQEAVNAIIGATNVLRQAKDSGLGLDEFLRQGDMFGGTDPAVAAMAMFIQQNNRSAKRMGTAFKAMAQFVESENARKQTAGLFGDAPASFTDIVGAANRKLEQEYGEGLFAIDQGDMFAAPAPAPAAAPDPTPPEPDEDDQLKAAKAFLDSLIEGTADLGSPAEVLARLEAIYVQWGEAELKDLFAEASNAYRDYALRVTAEAM